MFRHFVVLLIIFSSLRGFGQREIRIYLPSGADTIKAAAKILEEQLKKSSSLNFTYKTEKEFTGEGILLTSNPGSWPAYGKPLRGKGSEATLVVSTGSQRGIVIAGNTQLSVRHGIFIYLEKLGFRYYFPHPDWYVIPVLSDLYPKFTYTGEPSFAHRRIWYAYATGSKIADENYAFWFMANRLGGSLQAYVGHAYDDIVYRNKTTFNQHPEWLDPPATAGALPENPKFDYNNEALVQFVIDDVLKRLEKANANHTPLRMISVSPSDGLIGACNTPACKRMGTITDRVYSLINRVAKAVQKKYPGTWISGMAYADYSAPPTKKLEPNTFVSIATAFNYTNFTTEQLITEWSKKAGKVGVYDYLGLFVWDFDLPGQGQASRVNSIIANIKNYYKLGARGYDAESTPGSINKGLGHYIVSRNLWDANSNTNTIKAEFFSLCFGKASKLMADLWKEWEDYPYTSVRETDLASWIDIVQEAGRIETSPSVQKRLTHINMYFHYLYLYNKFKSSDSEADLTNLLVYCYNSFDWGALSGYPALWVLGNTSKLPGFKYADANAKYRKTVPAFARKEYIDQLAAEDRKQLRKKDKVSRQGLVATFRKAATVPAIFSEKKYISSSNTTAFTGPHNYVLEIKNPGNKNYLQVAAGANLGNSGDRPLVFSIFSYTNLEETNLQPLMQFDYTGHKDTQRIDLSKLKTGLYLLKVTAPGIRFTIDFSPSVSYAVIVTPRNKFDGYTRYMCFYVPAGTKKFRVFKQIETTFVSPLGRTIELNKRNEEESDVEVKAGEEGFWLISFLSGKLHIEGLPPFMGMNPSQMLIPK